MTTALTTKQKSDSIRDMLEKYQQPILDVLPKHIKPERAMRILQTACTRIPKLLDCSKSSLITSMVTAAEFDLEPNTPLGQCFIIPYGGQATFQMGYQGMCELAYRSKMIETISASTIHENDKFDWTEGTDAQITHKPVLGNRGPVIGYYAVVKLTNGGRFVAVMSKDDCHAHGRKYSKAYGRTGSGWKSAPDAMCKKTCIIAALKYAPKSIKDKDYELLLASVYADTDNSIHVKAQETATGTIDLDTLESVPLGEEELQPGGSAETAPQPEPIETTATIAPYQTGEETEKVAEPIVEGDELF